MVEKPRPYSSCFAPKLSPGGKVLKGQRIKARAPNSSLPLSEETALEGGFGGAAVAGVEVFVGDRVEKEKDLLRGQDNLVYIDLKN